MAAIFKKAHKMDGMVSIMVAPDGVAFAATGQSLAVPVKGKVYGYKPYKELAQLESILSDIVVSNELQGMNCNWVLHPNYYRFLQLDLPRVSEDEYISAIRWQIKDMIDFPIADAAIDVFLPPKNIATHYKKIFVIAAQQLFLQDITSVMGNVQLNLVAIDVHEFAIRNILMTVAKKIRSLVSSSEKDAKSISFLYLMEDKSIFLIAKNNDIHLVRYIEKGYSQLTDEETFDNLIAEVQRSINYYQQQLKQPKPDNFLLSPLPDSLLPQKQALLKKFTSALNTPTLCVNLNDVVAYSPPIPEALQAQCCIAVGGILRKEQA